MKINQILGTLGLVNLVMWLTTGNAVYGQENSQSDISELLNQIETYQTNSLGQVNNISQLRDVSPGDWAFEALRNLVERYGCIAGYPDGTYRGSRAMTRYEFAAGLNACLQQIERLITGFNPEELETLRRLLQEFEAELAALGARVDNLEGRVAFLEDHQFSTTTKLEGNVVFAAVGAGGNRVNGEKIDGEITLGHRTRLNFDTSFSGRDNLRVRLQADGLIGPNLHTPEGSLFFTDPDADNNLVIDALVYHFPIGDRTEIAIAANAGASDDFASTINVLDGDGSLGALSAFGSRHPIYYQVEDKGIGIKHQFNDVFELSLGYLASEAEDPSSGSGLFNGPYGAMAQLLITPTEKFELGFTYINAYNQSDTGTGSNLSNFRQFTEDNFGQAVPTSSNSYGVQFSWRITDQFVLGGWGGYSNIRTLSSLNGTIGRGEMDVWNWAATLAFPDLGKEGSLGGIIVGVEPKVTNSSVILPGFDRQDRDTSLHIEAFYQYQINDHIAITPGIIWLTAPDHNQNNDDIVIGMLRTTFSF
jgi:hypothetical protein